MGTRARLPFKVCPGPSTQYKASSPITTCGFVIPVESFGRHGRRGLEGGNPLRIRLYIESIDTIPSTWWWVGREGNRESTEEFFFSCCTLGTGAAAAAAAEQARASGGDRLSNLPNQPT